MKTHRNAKGQMRIIETILAAFIIFAAVSFMGIFAVNNPSSSYEVTDLEKMGYSALHDLDQQGLLASSVYIEGRWGDLRTALKITLPVDVYFELSAYNADGSRQVRDQIIYGDSAIFLGAKNAASVSYTLVGVPKLDTITRMYYANYEPTILVLKLTRG